MIGDITWQTVKVGQLDLLNSGEASFHGVDIYEDINDPFGSPLIELNVVDHSDALNKYKITGSYDENQIEIAFRNGTGGETVSFKARMQSNKGLQSAETGRGSLHSKTYQIRGMQEEWFRAQGKTIERHFASAPTTSHVERIFKDIGSNKPVETRAASEPREMTLGREHPINATQKMMHQHTSRQYRSNAYVIFQEWQNGNPKIIQTTYQQLFEQSPVVTLKERTDLNSTGISEQDQQNSIMWSEYSPSWSQTRPMVGARLSSFNNATHTVVDQNYRGDNPSRSPAWRSPASYTDNYYIRTVEDRFNNGQPHTNSAARTERAKYMAHLTQGNARIEIPGNPKIKLGSIIELDVPKKTDTNQFGGEGQFNKKALVVAIRHKIKPAGSNPRYTMVLELAKDGMEQGGSTA